MSSVLPTGAWLAKETRMTSVGWAPVPVPGPRSRSSRFACARAATSCRRPRADAGGAVLPTSRDEATERPAASSRVAYRHTPEASWTTE